MRIADHRKSSANSFIVAGFLSASSLLGSYSPPSNSFERVFFLPEYTYNYIFFFYCLFIAITMYFGLKVIVKGFAVERSQLPLIFGYFTLAIWAFASNSEQLRYVLLFLGVLLTPAGLNMLLKKSNPVKIRRFVFFTFFIFVGATYFFSFLNLSISTRVSGFHNNPNLMGMWVVSFLAVFLYFAENSKKSTSIIGVTLCMILVLMTGSRLAFGLFLLLIVPVIARKKYLPLLLGIGVFLIVFLYLGEIELTSRGLYLANAISDSGRNLIWIQAKECINQSWLVGHGMNGGVECVKSDNLHNSYLRLFVMLGTPLAVIFFIAFFLFTWKVLFSEVNQVLKFYFLGLPLAFFAEDYVVSFASPFFPFFLLMLSLLIYDRRKRNRL